MESSVLLAAAISGLIYGITPGPGVLAVLGIGADRGRPAASAFLAGHFAGDLVWSTIALISILGASQFSPEVFMIIGIISGSYLTWLGCRTIIAQRLPLAGLGGRNNASPLVHGLLFGFTNPKAYPVAAATMTSLLSSHAATLTWNMLPALVCAAGLGGLLAYLVLLRIVGVTLFRNFYRRNEIWIIRLSGILFIGFGVHTLAQGLPKLAGLLPVPWARS